MLKRLIIHPFTFAIFPILALLAFNITEVTPRIALRSLVISLIGTVIILLVLALITRNWQKAAIATTLILILFYSYGQVYEFLQAHPIFGLNFGRHRYLVILYGIILITGLWAIFFKSKDFTIATQVFNIIGILLLVYPLIQIESYRIHTSISEQQIAENFPKLDIPVLTKPKRLPDVYYIVLDGYTRGNAFLQDMDFDNSAFLQQLSDMGFYVANCSRANYGKTIESITTALNLDYIDNLEKEIFSQGFTNPEDVWTLLKQSKVRYLLESMGYKTVAFESGYEWTRLHDADIYLQYSGAPYEMQVFQPFEAMLIRSTALLIWSDSTYKSLPSFTPTIFATTKTAFEDHINRQLYILDQLPKIPSIPGPKFVFAHILIPHPPLVFTPNGDIQSDPGFYSENGYGPIDGLYEVKGYLNQIQFLNNCMPDILQTIITKSNVPPIIVLMSDHGSSFVDHYTILNAYFLPNNGEYQLYSSISPVNSFRVIFNTFFGAHFNLLPDISYDQDQPIPETFPECIQ